MSEVLLKISNVAGYGNISVLHEVSLDMSNMGRMKVRFTGKRTWPMKNCKRNCKRNHAAQNDTEDHKPGSSGEKCQTKVS